MDRTTLDLWVGIFVRRDLRRCWCLPQGGEPATFNSDEVYEVQAHFGNIGGSRPSADRRAPAWWWSGGRDRLRSKTYEATVKMRIDKLPVPKDTTASILTSGLLGEQYVGLEPAAMRLC